MQKFLFKYSIKIILLLAMVYILIIVRSEYQLGIPEWTNNKTQIFYLNSNLQTLHQKDQNDLLNAQPDVLIVHEWNGNNFSLDRWFEQGYTIAYEKKDTFTFGQVILSKFKINFKEINPTFSANCPYPILIGRYNQNGKEIIICPVHFPSPVPFCNFSTSAYTDLLLKHIQNENSNKEIILIGDFNSTLPFGSVRKFKNLQLNDSSAPLLLSWRPSTIFPALIKIDH